MLFLYNLILTVYGGLFHFVSLFHKKARAIRVGRSKTIGIIRKYRRQFPEEKIIWFHCASLGEFEQAKPLIDAIKEKNALIHIALSFYSPSGYEIRKDYDNADLVFYLLNDTTTNSEKFIRNLQPSTTIFTKYEFWFRHLSQLQNKNIPCYFISSTFSNTQYFFHPFFKPLKNILKGVDHFFVQDEMSKRVLIEKDITQTTITGDTRVDRVIENRKRCKKIDIIEKLKKVKPCIIYGSIWPEDLTVLLPFINSNPDFLHILVPHSVETAILSSIEHELKSTTRKLSKLSEEETDLGNLIVDKVGILACLYQYADLVYIGGGFGTGIHNTLEPAVFGTPLLFGPKYHKFKEARDFIEIGVAKSVKTAGDFEEAFRHFHSEEQLQTVSKSLSQYFDKHKGATDQLIHYFSANSII